MPSHVTPVDIEYQRKLEEEHQIEAWGETKGQGGWRQSGEWDRSELAQDKFREAGKHFSRP